ncbi:MAG: nucleotidyltransferase domain-containing protein [archaeon GB-1867-035]|nr:nucleotidyltransferase domain-containing protein [Candidatus Culexmicrobium profundum]
MKLRKKLELDLDRIVDALSSVEGVVAVILFGSRAKGDYDEYSDYDLLVIFKDDEVMWRNRRKLYENIGRLGLFTQVLTRSLRELWEETEPTFRENIFEHGLVLYMKYPLTVPAFYQRLKPMAIVRYDLKNLSQRDKMRVIYRLYGKQKVKGMIQKSGGLKLGDGCFLIPMEKLEDVIKVLKYYNVNFSLLKVYTQVNGKILCG